MKKLLFIISALFFFFPVQAQFRFYGGLQAGPKLSFSNVVVSGWPDLNYQAYSKVRRQQGIVAGYNFRGDKFSLEAGYSIHTYGVALNFPDHEVYGQTPDLWYNLVGEQLSLAGKMTLNNPASKVLARGVFGGAYFRNWGLGKSNFNSYLDTDRYGFISYPYPENPGIDFGFRPGYGLLEFFPNNTVWLMQGGFEVQMKAGRHLNLSLSVIYQNSFKPIEARSMEFTYHYDRSVIYDPIKTITVLSKAEAINLNLGLTYAFVKRKEKELSNN